MFRTTILYSALFAILVSCGSSTMPVELIPPEMRVREAAGQLRPFKDGERVPLYLLVDVFNHSSERITLKRLVVQRSPISQSGMKFDPVVRSYGLTIPPSSVRTIDLHIVAWVELPNLDSGSSTTVRAQAYFDSELGGFRQTYNLPIVMDVPDQRRNE